MVVDEYIIQFKEVHPKVEILIAHVHCKCLSVALIERFFYLSKLTFELVVVSNDLLSAIKELLIAGDEWILRERFSLGPLRLFLLNVIDVVVCTSHGRLELKKEDPMQLIISLIWHRRQRATEKLLHYWTWWNNKVSSV